jgi:hypothetical protein
MAAAKPSKDSESGSGTSSAEQRAAKVAAFKREEEKAKRTRIVAIVSAAVAIGAIGAILVTIAVTNNPAPPAADPSTAPTAVTSGDGTIAGLLTFDLAQGGHVTTTVDYASTYGMNPPAGGDHNPAWLNCGIYDQPQQNENAVHSLEHGAVWVTYDPDRVSAAHLDRLRAAMPDSYAILSPYPGLPSAVVVSAWGAQVQLDGTDDPRLQEFIEIYWRSASSPEPSAPCTGAIDGPGLIG